MNYGLNQGTVEYAIEQLPKKMKEDIGVEWKVVPKRAVWWMWVLTILHEIFTFRWFLRIIQQYKGKSFIDQGYLMALNVLYVPGTLEDWNNSSSSHRLRLMLHEMQHIYDYNCHNGYKCMSGEERCEKRSWISRAWWGISYFIWPVPILKAWNRANKEKSAIRRELELHILREGTVRDWFKENVIRNMTGSFYGFPLLKRDAEFMAQDVARLALDDWRSDSMVLQQFQKMEK